MCSKYSNVNDVPDAVCDRDPMRPYAVIRKREDEQKRYGCDGTAAATTMKTRKIATARCNESRM